MDIFLKREKSTWKKFLTIVNHRLSTKLRCKRKLDKLHLFDGFAKSASKLLRYNREFSIDGLNVRG